MTTNIEASVITFPKERIKREIPNETRSHMVEKAQKKATADFAETISMEISAAVFEDFKAYGLDVDSKQFDNDFTYLTNVLSAVVHRMLDLPHPFQEVVDKVEFLDPEEVKPIQ